MSLKDKNFYLGKPLLMSLDWWLVHRELGKPFMEYDWIILEMQVGTLFINLQI